MNNLISEQSRCIAHEIRNHISICELYTRIIKKNLENEGVENDSIDNAIKCITKSLKIMNNSLLDLKSLNNFSPEICDIQAVLQEGINLSTVYIGDKDIKINLDAKDTAPVYIDENKFLACMVNIIKNAIEAINDKGEIKISLEICQKLPSLGTLPSKRLSIVCERFAGGEGLPSAVIKISNNGEPVKNPENIFKAGFTTKQTGSGLGLHICANNLQAQNAELKLTKSTPEITEFEITLPVYKN